MEAEVAPPGARQSDLPVSASGHGVKVLAANRSGNRRLILWFGSISTSGFRALRVSRALTEIEMNGTSTGTARAGEAVTGNVAFRTAEATP